MISRPNFQTVFFFLVFFNVVELPICEMRSCSGPRTEPDSPLLNKRFLLSTLEKMVDRTDIDCAQSGTIP